MLGGCWSSSGSCTSLAISLAGDKLPKDAQISGVAVGGLEPAEAIQKLTAELGARAAEPIELTVGEDQAQLKPADAGLAIDYAKSVDAAGGGKSLNPRQILTVLTGGQPSMPWSWSTRPNCRRGRVAGQDLRPGSRSTQRWRTRARRSSRSTAPSREWRCATTAAATDHGAAS